VIKKINIKKKNVANKMNEQKKNTTPSERSKKSNNQRNDVETGDIVITSFSPINIVSDIH
jgi:hypothetical protein